MKIAATLAVALLSASTFAFAADNNGGDNNNGGNNGQMDDMTTGSTRTSDPTGDLADQENCREGTGGGAPCQEQGTTMGTQQ
jgi:hypothetical protein